MNRKVKAKDSMSKSFYETDFLFSETDPDFNEIIRDFIFGDVYQYGTLTDKERELINIVILTTNQSLETLKFHIQRALNNKISPIEMKEALYQCAPYIGISKVLEGLRIMNGVFKVNNISLPLESQKKVNENNRFEEGLKVQKSIFGDSIDKMHAASSRNQKHIKKDYLSAMCFGDFYTRGGLDLKTREMLTFCILSAMGGCENQLKAHIHGNVKVGNDKEKLLSSLTQCIPYIGYPRTLNALACMNEVIPENDRTE